MSEIFGVILILLGLGVVVLGAAFIVGALFKCLPFRIQRKIWSIIDKF